MGRNPILDSLLSISPWFPGAGSLAGRCGHWTGRRWWGWSGRWRTSRTWTGWWRGSGVAGRPSWPAEKYKWWLDVNQQGFLPGTHYSLSFRPHFCQQSWSFRQFLCRLPAKIVGSLIRMSNENAFWYIQKFLILFREDELTQTLIHPLWCNLQNKVNWMFLKVSISPFTLVVFAEDSESLLELIFCVRIPDLFVHQVTKFRKFNESGAIHINLNNTKLSIQIFFMKDIKFIYSQFSIIFILFVAKGISYAINHILNFWLCWILSCSSHSRMQFLQCSEW